MTNSDNEESNDKLQPYAMTSMKAKKSRALKVDITSDMNSGRISTLVAAEDEMGELKAMAQNDLVRDKKNLQEAKAKEEAIKVILSEYHLSELSSQKYISRFRIWKSGSKLTKRVQSNWTCPMLLTNN